jgi:hypothetical protein
VAVTNGELVVKVLISGLMFASGKKLNSPYR